MDTSETDSSSDDSLSFDEQIHLDTLSAIAAASITTKLKEKLKTGIVSDVNSNSIANVSDDEDYEDISYISREQDIEFPLNKKPLLDVQDTCNRSRGVYLSSPTNRKASEKEATKQNDKNCATRPGDNNEHGEKNEESIQLASSLQCSIQSDDCYVVVNWSKDFHGMGSSVNRTNKDSDKELMKKSVITEDFEKKETIPPYSESIRQMKKKRRLEREKTKGKNWFHMPAPEMTEEKKQDLSILQMRNALDPKRFYKGNDIKALPRYFQFGQVVETPADFYHARIPKKQRKATIVDELLADVETRIYNKRKYTEIQEAKRKRLGPYRHMKRLKKKKR